MPKKNKSAIEQAQESTKIKMEEIVIRGSRAKPSYTHVGVTSAGLKSALKDNAAFIKKTKNYIIGKGSYNKSLKKKKQSKRY